METICINLFKIMKGNNAFKLRLKMYKYTYTQKSKMYKSLKEILMHVDMNCQFLYKCCHHIHILNSTRFFFLKMEPGDNLPHCGKFSLNDPYFIVFLKAISIFT